MVQFGKRFESAQKGRWQRHNADYERLKLLLALATKAHERAPSTAHVSNYGDAGGGDVGLLAKAAGGDGGPPPGAATLWLKNRGAARVPRPASLNNLSLLGGAASPGAADDESWHWTRWLFSSKMPESYPLLVHGFGVALVAELAKVEALYARELDVLESRWQDSLADDDDAPRPAARLRQRGRRGDAAAQGGSDYSAVDVGGPAPGARRRRMPSPRKSARAPDAAEVARAVGRRQLVDFTVWNFTAFTKITKKRDKKFKHERPIRERFCAVVRERDCWARRPRSLLADVHARYAELFTDGDATEAQLELRETTRGMDDQGLYGGRSPIAALRFGYRAGVAATLAVWVMWDCVEVVDSVHKHTSHDSVAAKAAWPVFRVCGVLLAWHWLWGVSLHVWSRFRVNAQFLFDVVDTPRQPAPTASDVFDECILETNVLLGLWSSPAVCVLPVWFRFAQCLRKYRDVGDSAARWVHFWNAGKYALSLVVTLWSALAGRSPTAKLEPGWVFFFLLSSAYSWVWDVTVDWGLVVCRRSRKHEGGCAPLSRPTRMYPRSSWYRFAAAFDVFGRFVWLATLVPPTAFGSSIHEFLPDYLTPVLALAELARRCVWGFFRLENEHISNAFMHRREGNSVPSHLRRAPKKEPNKRALSIVEAVAIAVLVITLLTRMTLAKRDAEYHLHHDHAPNDGVPNATLAPRAADDDDALRVYDDAAVHHHHHSATAGVSFDDDDDSVPGRGAHALRSQHSELQRQYHERTEELKRTNVQLSKIENLMRTKERLDASGGGGGGAPSSAALRGEHETIIKGLYQDKARLERRNGELGARAAMAEALEKRKREVAVLKRAARGRAGNAAAAAASGPKGDDARSLSQGKLAELVQRSASAASSPKKAGGSSKFLEGLETEKLERELREAKAEDAQADKEDAERKASRVDELQERVGDLQGTNRRLEDELTKLCEAPFISEAYDKQDRANRLSELERNDRDAKAHIEHLQEGARAYDASLKKLREKAPDLKRKLDKLREDHLQLQYELERSEKMLKVQMSINRDLHLELEDKGAKQGGEKRDLIVKLEDYEALNVKRLQRINVLEAQLRQARYATTKRGGGGRRARPGPRGRRASVASSRRRNALLMELKSGELAADENLVEVWIVGMDLDDGLVSPGSSTFAVVDFLNFESQATRGCRARNPSSTSRRPRVSVDDLFLRYLATESLDVEVCEAQQADYELVAKCALFLDRHPAERQAIEKVMLAQLGADASPDESNDDAAGKLVNEVEIVVHSASGLRGRADDAKPSPYVHYQLLQFADSFTPVQRATADPTFEHVLSFPLATTAQALALLRTERLAFTVLDFVDEGDGGAGADDALGSVEVSLGALADGERLRDAAPPVGHGARRGHARVAARWKFDFKTARTTSGATLTDEELDWILATFSPRKDGQVDYLGFLHELDASPAVASARSKLRAFVERCRVAQDRDARDLFGHLDVETMGEDDFADALAGMTVGAPRDELCAFLRHERKATSGRFGTEELIAACGAQKPVEANVRSKLRAHVAKLRRLGRPLAGPFEDLDAARAGRLPRPHFKQALTHLGLELVDEAPRRGEEPAVDIARRQAVERRLGSVIEDEPYEDDPRSTDDILRDVDAAPSAAEDDAARKQREFHDRVRDAREERERILAAARAEAPPRDAGDEPGGLFDQRSRQRRAGGRRRRRRRRPRRRRRLPGPDPRRGRGRRGRDDAAARVAAPRGVRAGSPEAASHYITADVTAGVRLPEARPPTSGAPILAAEDALDAARRRLEGVAAPRPAAGLRRLRRRRRRHRAPRRRRGGVAAPRARVPARARALAAVLDHFSRGDLFDYGPS
ncbi:thromboxane A2 receptor binding protein [Aureococcus anophagefferens]|nr:thromboxane A2 receptor binding protein [Aureococcus anophagefferens]